MTDPANRLKPRHGAGRLIVPALGVLALGAPAFAQMRASDFDSYAIRPFISLDSLTLSDDLPIVDISNNLRSERFKGGGDAALTRQRARVGVSRGRWDAALIGRYDYNVDYSPDLGELANASLNGGQLTDGSKRIDLALNYSRGLGAEVGYTATVGNRVNIRVGIQGFRADRGIDGSLDGNSLLVDGSIDSGVVDIDYVYTDDLLLERDIEARAGYGVSLNARMDARLSDRLAVAVDVDDAVGRVFWGDIDRTVADADTRTFTRDDEGLVLVRPILRGRNTVESHVQKLRTHIRAEADYELSPEWAVNQSVDKVGPVWLATSGVDYRPNPDVAIGPRYEWSTGAAGVDLTLGKLQVSAMADSLQPDSARFLRVNAGFDYRF